MAHERMMLLTDRRPGSVWVILHPGLYRMVDADQRPGDPGASLGDAAGQSIEAIKFRRFHDLSPGDRKWYGASLSFCRKLI